MIEAFSAALAAQVEQALGQSHQPMVIGGDHSVRSVPERMRPVAAPAGSLGLI